MLDNDCTGICGYRFKQNQHDQITEIALTGPRGSLLTRTSVSFDNTRYNLTVLLAVSLPADEPIRGGLRPFHQAGWV